MILDQNNNTNKVYTLLGFAQKAGKIISGSNSVELVLGKPESKLAIIAKDSSPNYLKQIQSKCEHSKQRYVVFGEKDQLGNCIGKSQRTAIVLKDSNIATAILDIVNKVEPF